MTPPEPPVSGSVWVWVVVVVSVVVVEEVVVVVGVVVDEVVVVVVVGAVVEVVLGVEAVLVDASPPDPPASAITAITRPMMTAATRPIATFWPVLIPFGSSS